MLFGKALVQLFILTQAASIVIEGSKEINFGGFCTDFRLSTDSMTLACCQTS